MSENSKIIKGPGILLIGSTCRKVGKTDLATDIIRRFRLENIVAVKVTPIHPDRPCPSGEGSCGACASLRGPFEIEEENSDSGDKDTQRMLAAGAKRAFWLRAREEHLHRAMEHLKHLIAKDDLCVVESCSVREVMAPDLFILVGKNATCEWKDSARRVRKYADRFVDVHEPGGFSPDEISLSDGRWSLPTHASAIILAGGKSSRMGEDKSMMDMDGKPMISVLVGQLEGLFGELIISSNDVDKYSFLGLKVVTDREPGQGPLMGIASSLEASSTGRNLVVACDIPTMDRALIRELLVGLDRADVVIPADKDGRLEPLFAAYRKSVAGPMFRALRKGRRRIVDAFEGLRVKRIELQDHEKLANLNTPKDRREWKVARHANDDRL